MTGDAITLTVPRDRSFFRVAHLVIGGLAVRLDLTFEALEDLQLALVGLLEGDAAHDAVTVSVRVDDAALRTTVGPFDRDRLQTALADDANAPVGLRRILDTVADDVEIRDDADGQWVAFTKHVELGRRA